MLFRLSLIFATIGLLVQFGSSQEGVIRLANPSFEGVPHAGTGNGTSVISGWRDCGAIYFKTETAPDIHNSNDPGSIPTSSIYFGVKQKASDGFTFLGMVARDNESYESVSQYLESPILKDQCYSFTIDLSQSQTYISPYPRISISKVYDRPIVLRIFGGSKYCDKKELLGESTIVDHQDWQTYDFTFAPTMTHQFITLVAFYQIPFFLPYNGNLLVDNAGDIIPIPCPEVIAEMTKPAKVQSKPPKDAVAVVKKNEPKTKGPVVPKSMQAPPKKEMHVPEKLPQRKSQKPKVEKPKELAINKELDRSKIKEGQTINIKNLYFEADKAQITGKSYESLEELANFLKANEDVKVEIGGHTNGQPTHEWCDSLSQKRALAVRNYLIKENIPAEQLEYKGYGKRNPIASNATKEGRTRNQRVEIKILKVDQ